MVLSGMSTLQQVRENVVSAERSGVAILTGPELELIGEARDTYWSLFAAPCTGCGYCVPCPNSVDIPRSLAMLNMAVMYDDMEDQRSRYRRMSSPGSEWILAASCVQCGECESKCPQAIAISEWMPYIHRVLGEGRPYCRRDRPR